MSLRHLAASLTLTLSAVFILTAQDCDEQCSSIVKITTPSGQGSGVVVALESDAAVVLTLSHVIKNADRYTVVFAGDATRGSHSVVHQEAFLGWDLANETFGLAAFRVRIRGGIPTGVRAAVLGEASVLKRKDEIEYWGYPNGTAVAFKSTRYSAPGLNFVLDQPLGGGASGGGLFKDGKLVGLAAGTGDVQSVGVPSEIALAALRGWEVRLAEGRQTRDDPATRTPTIAPQRRGSTITVTGDPAVSGLVTDTTGAVLPGVTVEVEGAAILEGKRSVVTDADGRYHISNLPAGTYSLAFQLPGFRSARRQGVSVRRGESAVVNVELSLASIPRRR